MYLINISANSSSVISHLPRANSLNSSSRTKPWFRLKIFQTFGFCFFSFRIQNLGTRAHLQIGDYAWNHKNVDVIKFHFHLHQKRKYLKLLEIFLRLPDPKKSVKQAKWGFPKQTVRFCWNGMILNWFEKDELKRINYHTTEIADWLISDDHKMALVVVDGATCKLIVYLMLVCLIMAALMRPL